MQKAIIFVCAGTGNPRRPGVWAQAAQTGSAQDNQELRQQIKQDAKRMAEELAQVDHDQDDYCGNRRGGSLRRPPGPSCSSGGSYLTANP